MKHIFIIFTLGISTLFGNDLAWVDEQIAAIKPARVGITDESIENLKDPFVFLEKNGYKKIVIQHKKVTKKKKTVVKKVKKHYIPKLHLQIIVNNSAKIDGKWYRVGDSIKGYKLLDIQKKSIVVSYNGKKSTLYIQKQKSNLKIKTR